ncbi:MAG: Rpn family recombination-promoting nuclease/putative transposase [Lachnospiraceae bacterium]|nr:Rpn family recombination-promoting nuclease/putative transposase [Lachnospiraceae bacterium]
MKKKKIYAPADSVNLANATGAIDYCFTNDYMFRAILQKNKRVLKALICSLLRLDLKDILSLEITNPIELGKSIDDKDFILDIAIVMNDNTFINLEMQIENHSNWTERSLSYLCRSFDQLYTGEDYASAGPAIHIGFLNFTPFKEHPEFYSTYKLMNIKNHHIYSDKFILGVVDLTKIDMASEDDRAYHLDYWAKLFKATTWEEIKMIAKKNKYLEEASEALYTMNADETIRAQCRARADYYRLHNTINRKMNELTSKVEALSSENDELASQNDELASQNDRLTSENDRLASEKDRLASEKDRLASQNEHLKKLLEEKGISYIVPDEK